MENKVIARTLRLLSQLMELHDENPFKVRSMANAAFKVDKLPFPIAKKSLGEMENIDGVGKSTASRIWSLIQTGTIPELSDLLAKTPPGIVEMMKIKGLGPKKIIVIWKDLGIDNVGELYYACNENRLIEAKGFGLKTQEEIKKVIEFNMAGNGCFLYARVEKFGTGLQEALAAGLSTDVLLTGQYRRRCEILDCLELLTAVPVAIVKDLVSRLEGAVIREETENILSFDTAFGIITKIHCCDPAQLGWQLILTTGSKEHTNKLALQLVDVDVDGKTEKEIYASAGLAYIEPELRECTNEFGMAAANSLPALIVHSDLKGTLHNHSTWSDGVHTLEEMALFCRDQLGLQYLGICDHSRSAFYANGLNETRVAAQHREIDTINEKLAPFKIFKGIESDILFDGSLDYENETLASFDFVVASVHSVLKMSEEKATQRLIRAIENPYTTILGHPTGRLLLSRSGYPIDHRRVIDACAANDVVIEINANPLRLDLDWRWHQYALEKGVMLSINPDAHRNEGFHDMHYGILVARKGGLSKDKCLNAMDLHGISAWLKKKKDQLEKK